MTHFSNIDYLLAIWQALNDDNTGSTGWVETTKTGLSNWNTVQGDKDIEDTPLYPFKATQKLWFDSKKSGDTSVRRTERFGYNYKEIAEAKSKKDLINAIRLLYTNIPLEAQRSRAGDPNAGDFLLAQAAILKKNTTPQVTANHVEFVKLAEELPEPKVLRNLSVRISHSSKIWHRTENTSNGSSMSKPRNTLLAANTLSTSFSMMSKRITLRFGRCRRATSVHLSHLDNLKRLVAATARTNRGIAWKSLARFP